MKQQADKELTSIRRILDILNGLPPSHRKRVMAFVNDRLDNPPVEVPTNKPDTVDARDLARLPVSPGLPFPDQEATKKAVADMGPAGGGALIGFDSPLVKQQALTGIVPGGVAK